MNNCVAGCKVYGNINSGENEFYHHKNCPNYPESLSEVIDNLKSKLLKSQENMESLKASTNKSKLLDRLKLIIDTERFVDIRKYEECCKIISQLHI